MSAASQSAPAVLEVSTAVHGCSTSASPPTTPAQRFDRRHPWFPEFQNCAYFPSSLRPVCCSFAAEARKPALRHPPEPPSGARAPVPCPTRPSPRAHRAPATTSLAQSSPTPRCGWSTSTGRRHRPRGHRSTSGSVRRPTAARSCKRCRTARPATTSRWKFWIPPGA